MCDPKCAVFSECAATCRRELEGFLACGIVSMGAVRVRCPTCGFDRLVDVSTHLCTNVIPDVPLRQWVITVPPPVRYLLAYDAELLAHVVRIFVHAVFAHLRQVARREVALLQKRGQWIDADPSEDDFAQREPLLAALASASRS